MMEWIHTPDSSAIDGFGYDAVRRTLEVEFKHGETYAYFKVPPGIFEEMKAADSKGHFVTERVKGVFEFQDKRDLVRPRVRVRTPRQ
jgi:hypothetical protein